MNNNNYNNYNNMNNRNFNETLQVLFNDLLNANERYFPATTTQSVMQNSLYERNPVRHVITEEVKHGLLPIKFRDATDRENNSQCSITCEPFQEDDDIIQLPCNHCFFVDPIMKWLTEESCECPVCRYKFDSMEKNVVETSSSSSSASAPAPTPASEPEPEPEQIEEEIEIEIEPLVHDRNRNSFIRYDDFYDHDYNYIRNYYPRTNNINLINLINEFNEFNEIMNEIMNDDER